MKPSKLMFAVAGIMTIATANALTTEEIKQRCNTAKDTVWDSYNNTCIPRNPCKDDKYASYCVKLFADTQLKDLFDGQVLASAYARFTDAQVAKCDILEWPGLVGQDYIGCTYNNGHYVVFEFDDLSENGKQEIPSDITSFSRSGEYGCYGYPHSEGFAKAEYGQWIKSPILPDLCFVEENMTDSFGEKYCTTDFVNDDLVVAVFQIIREGSKVEFFKETSPGGTKVECVQLLQ